ncbi:hypothetical protein RYH80_18240 [Halobaculum sp. MBLA0147]|uniref:hypothetical protein n=1 Tax=Halobaculum sp. MBLA0147 TaxID=3079934 RepID=UPI003523B335
MSTQTNLSPEISPDTPGDTASANPLPTKSVANRRMIASRSQLTVAVSSGPDTTYQFERTGDWWPYRALSLRTAIDHPQTVTRTAKQSLRWFLVDTRPPGYSLPDELLETAQTYKPSLTVPNGRFSGGRDAAAYPVDMVDAFTQPSAPRLALPIPQPVEYVAATAANQLGANTQAEPIGERSRPAVITIQFDPDAHQSGTEVWDDVLTVAEQLPVATNIILRFPTITTELVRRLREPPSLVDGIILPPNPQADVRAPATAQTVAEEYDSALATDSSPATQLAADVAFLSGSLVADDAVEEALSHSVIPA